MIDVASILPENNFIMNFICYLAENKIYQKIFNTDVSYDTGKQKCITKYKKTPLQNKAGYHTDQARLTREQNQANLKAKVFPDLCV